MQKKIKTIMLALIIFFIPMVVHADIGAPFIGMISGIIIYPVVVIVEAIAFFLFTRVIYKKKIDLIDVIKIILIANLVSTLIGGIYPIIGFLVFNLFFLVISYFLTVLVEYLVIKKRMLRLNYTLRQIVILTFLFNSISYAIFAGIWINEARKTGIYSLYTGSTRSLDARRVSDIKQIQAALELYLNQEGYYPENLQSITGITITNGYTLKTVPVNPRPNIGKCSKNFEYQYTRTNNGAFYELRYCLGLDIGGINSGYHTATPAGIADP